MGYEFRSSREYGEKSENSRLEYIDISVFANGEDDFSKGLTEGLKKSLKLMVEEPEVTKPLLEILNKGTDAYMQSL